MADLDKVIEGIIKEVKKDNPDKEDRYDRLRKKYDKLKTFFLKNRRDGLAQVFVDLCEGRISGRSFKAKTHALNGVKKAHKKEEITYYRVRQ